MIIPQISALSTRSHVACNLKRYNPTLLIQVSQTLSVHDSQYSKQKHISSNLTWLCELKCFYTAGEHGTSMHSRKTVVSKELQLSSNMSFAETSRTVYIMGGVIPQLLTKTLTGSIFSPPHASYMKQMLCKYIFTRFHKLHLPF